MVFTHFWHILPLPHHRNSTSTRKNVPRGLKFCKWLQLTNQTSIQHNFNPAIFRGGGVIYPPPGLTLIQNFFGLEESMPPLTFVKAMKTILLNFSFIGTFVLWRVLTEMIKKKFWHLCAKEWNKRESNCLYEMKCMSVCKILQIVCCPFSFNPNLFTRLHIKKGKINFFVTLCTKNVHVNSQK